MTQKKLVIGLLGLGAMGLTSHQKTNSENKNTKMSVDEINSSSLKAIESAWIQVPRTCKARGFNADPSISIERISTDAKVIYESA